ncbi:MAG: hypothetical protein K0Q72_3224, partial [Armatimonadetes bacterium]|nr:hypothetical protein [Armatimonadota bacterium]
MDKDWILDGFGEPREGPVPIDDPVPVPPPGTAPIELPGGWLIDDRPVEPEPAADEPSDAEDTDYLDDEGEDPGRPDAAELLRKARFMLDVDRPKDALRALQELIDWYPTDHDAWCEVCRAFRALDDRTRAKRAAQLAIEADPYSAGGYAATCALQIQDQEWKAALKTAQDGSEMTYRDADVERWKVRAWLAGGKRQEAQEYLAQGPGLPEDAEVAFLRGEVARLAEDLPTADAEFRRSIALNPGHGEAWAGLAAVLLKQERHPEAVQCVHQAAQHSPDEGSVPSRTIEVIDAWVGKRFSARAGYGMTAMLVSIFCTPGPGTLFLFPAGLIWYLTARPLDRARRERVLADLPRDLREYYQTQKQKDVRSTWEGLGCLVGLLVGVVAVIAGLTGLFSRFGWEGALRVLLLLGVVSLPILWKLLTRDDAAKERAVRFRFPGDPYVPVTDAVAEEEAEEEREPEPPGEWEPDPVWAGWQFLQEGKATSAREQARTALSGDPENVDALVLYSAASLHLSEFETGEAAAKSARTHDPEDVRAHALVWANLAAAGKLEEAVASAEEDRLLADNAAGYLVWLVRTQFHSGSPEIARSISTLVQRLYPGSSEPHEVEGEWAYDSGRWADAEAAYRRALALDPESATLHSDLAWTLERRWRFGEAREASRRALAVDAEEPNARTLIERQVSIGLAAGGALLSVLLSLVAALPTFQGSPTNRWMIAATLGGPFLAGAGIFFLVRPVLRRIAPGLLLETG